MKIKDLIKELQAIENKERKVQILIGDEDNDYIGCDTINLLHTDDVEQCVEVFCLIDNTYKIKDGFSINLALNPHK